MVKEDPARSRNKEGDFSGSICPSYEIKKTCKIHTRSKLLWATKTFLLLILLNVLLLICLLLLLGGLDNSSRNPVQIPLTVLGNSPSSIFCLLEHADFLKGLADFALHGRGRVGVVRGAVAPSVATTVEFCQGTDTDVLAEVYVPCNGSYCTDSTPGCTHFRTFAAIRTCTDIEPIGIVGCEFLERGGFDEINPNRNLEFSRALQVGSVGGDEGLCAREDTDKVVDDILFF